MSENPIAGGPSVPRYRDRTRFGVSNAQKGWIPFEVVEGVLLFACGHSGKVIVGSTPDTSEEEVKEFLQKVAGKPCASCETMPKRLRSFQNTSD